MTKLVITQELNEDDKAMIRFIKAKTIKDLSNLNELYDNILINGFCESARPSDVYYVAYTLADKFKLEVVN